MIAIPAGFSPQDYLEIERRNTIRHEYRLGLVYAMAGGIPNHNRLALNLVTKLSAHLGDDCQFFSSDIKVNYSDNFYYYPDVFVTCDARDKNDLPVKRYPKMLCEVLSSSTQNFDRTDKFEDYRLINTLEEYVLISQDEMRVECFCPQHGEYDPWQSLAYGRGESVIFTSIALEIPIAELYRGTSIR